MTLNLRVCLTLTLCLVLSNACVLPDANVRKSEDAGATKQAPRTEEGDDTKGKPAEAPDSGADRPSSRAGAGGTAGGTAGADTTKGSGGMGGKASSDTGPAAGDVGNRSAADGGIAMDAGKPIDYSLCRAELNPTTQAPGTPTIWLVLDGSGSMIEMLGDISRWQAMSDALMSPATGVVKALEGSVKWGMVMYDGASPAGIGTPLTDGGTPIFSTPPATTCPRVFTVEPKLNNHADIQAIYPPDPLGGSTPTDRALTVVRARLPATLAGPTVVVLATDGAPNDLCSTDIPLPDVRPDVIKEVQKLAMRGVKTYVISLAGDDQSLTEHLTQVAQAGATGKPPFLPRDSAQLLTVVKTIATAEVASCNLPFKAQVQIQSSCDVHVKLNGVSVLCSSSDGFIVDGAVLRLLGAACAAYQGKSDALEVQVPCRALSSM